MSAANVTFRYLTRGYKVMTVIAFISMLACVAFTDLIYRTTDAYDGVLTDPTVTKPLTTPSDITAWIFAMITGMILFLINFRVALINGISRKTFMQASLPVAALFAAALAIFNMLVVTIHGWFWPIALFSQITFQKISWIELLLLQFARNFVFIMTGWFIMMAYYRSGTWMRWVITLSPALYIGLSLVIDAQTNGAYGRMLGDYFHFTMRSTPLMATLTMLVYAGILFGFVCLMLRRAPLKG